MLDQIKERVSDVEMSEEEGESLYLRGGENSKQDEGNTPKQARNQPKNSSKI